MLLLLPSDHEGPAVSGITRPGGAIPSEPARAGTTRPGGAIPAEPVRESRRLRLVRTLRKVETLTLRAGSTPWRDAEKRKGGSND